MIRRCDGGRRGVKDQDTRSRRVVQLRPGQLDLLQLAEHFAADCGPARASAPALSGPIRNEVPLFRCTRSGGLCSAYTPCQASVDLRAGRQRPRAFQAPLSTEAPQLVSASRESDSTFRIPPRGNVGSSLNEWSSLYNARSCFVCAENSSGCTISPETAGADVGVGEDVAVDVGSGVGGSIAPPTIRSANPITPTPKALARDPSAKRRGLIRPSTDHPMIANPTRIKIPAAIATSTFQAMRKPRSGVVSLAETSWFT